MDNKLTFGNSKERKETEKKTILINNIKNHGKLL